MFTNPVQRPRYPPTAQQFAVVRLKHARLATLGLAVSAFPAHRSSAAPDPWPCEPAEASKALDVCVLLAFVCSPGPL
jgi:hypothetical protein